MKHLIALAGLLSLAGCLESEESCAESLLQELDDTIAFARQGAIEARKHADLKDPTTGYTQLDYVERITEAERSKSRIPALKQMEVACDHKEVFGRLLKKP